VASRRNRSLQLSTVEKKVIPRPTIVSTEVPSLSKVFRPPSLNLTIVGEESDPTSTFTKEQFSESGSLFWEPAPSIACCLFQVFQSNHGLQSSL